MYYEVVMQCGRQFPYIILALPKLVPILRENAIKTLPTLRNIKLDESAPQVLETVDNSIVKYLPVFDVAINVWNAVRKRNDIPVDKKTQMEQSAINTKVQETLLSAIDDSGLLGVFREAIIQDIEGVKEKDGSSHRFTTIEKLWPSEKLKKIQTAFREGNPQPLFSQIAATQSLCMWNSSLVISPGAAKSRQRILDNTFAFQTRMQMRFNDIIKYQEPVSQSDPLFTEFHVWANSMPYMRENLDETEKQAFKKPDQYWQEREPELIAMGFQKGCEQYQENVGIEISPIELESYTKQFIEKKLF
nr:hypothetical protein [Klebsormidium nitens]